MLIVRTQNQGIFAAMNTGQKQSLVEQMGYGPDARLLIVHADDLGLTEDVNSAFAGGQERGLINSGSAMVPCPAFAGIAAYARAHPKADIGLHLTLTCPKVATPWGPVAPASDVSSLVDHRGCLHEQWTSATSIRLEEVEAELRAQIESAIESGLHPTHLDSHQFLLQRRNARLFEIFARLGLQYDLPLLVSREWFRAKPYLQPIADRGAIILDRVSTIESNMPPDRWPDFYRSELRKLPPGVSEILIHPAHDTEELRTFFQGRQEWGAAWRQRDLDFFTSDEFSSLMREENIQLVTWREIVARSR
jgi:predicted glycoside hydrolase/deacetylase ChbG (UPF0249 family)